MLMELASTQSRLNTKGGSQRARRTLERKGRRSEPEVGVNEPSVQTEAG